jgi:carbon-monoxide dehydrogenase medium subunit
VKNFEYFEPTTVSEACSLLSKLGPECKILAGGTDLLVQMKQGALLPKNIINIKKIPGLNYVQKGKNGSLKIGALTSIHTLDESLKNDKRFGMIGHAAFLLGSPQIRNVATLGGNLCNAAPSADMAPALIALDASASIASLRGSRILSLQDLFTGPGHTLLDNTEMLTEIEIPTPPLCSAGCYEKIGRIKLVDIAVVCLAVWISIKNDAENVCDDIRIVAGAVAPTPMRVKSAESILRGKRIDERVIEEISKMASEEVRPISDVRAPENYRREMVKVLTARALRGALKKLKH